MSTANHDTGDLSPGRSPARRLARRLIEARQSEQSQSESPARAAAAAADGLYRELSRWVGLDGCHALFTRSLSQARTDFPALAQIAIRARSQPHIDSVPETIIARGDPATAEALEFMLERLVKLLGRLIGDDMATKLIERSIPVSGRSPASDDGQEEA